MIKIKHSGSFRKAEKFLKTMSKREYMATLRRYGQQGVDALMLATPKDETMDIHFTGAIALPMTESILLCCCSMAMRLAGELM